MKRFLFIAMSLAIISCGKENTAVEQNTQPMTYNVSGLVEKGPFVSGSTINLQPLNGEYTPVGTNFHGEIKDNEGSFNLGSLSLSSPYAIMTANGYFYNEVTGNLSQGTLTLNAIVDLTNKSTVNVNLLTHLKYYRVQHLLKIGTKFKEADAQAQKELFEAFGLQKYNTTDVSQFSIAKGTEQSAAMIAISSLLLVGRTEAQITEYLADLSNEFGENGFFSVDTKRTMMADLSKLSNHLESIQNHITDRYLSLGKQVSVPDLYGYFDWDGDGIADGGSTPSFTIKSTKPTSYGYEITFISNRNWSVERKTSGLTLSPESGKASEQEQSMEVRYEITDISQIGEVGTIEIAFADKTTSVSICLRPTPKHSDKRVLLLYSAGFNSLSSYLKDDIKDLCNGFVPTEDDDNNVLLVFERSVASYGNYSEPSSPVLYRVYLDNNSNPAKDTLKKWDATTPASSKETMQSALGIVSQKYPGYSYGMVFSSHGTGWLPAGYYGNSSTFENAYENGQNTSNVSTKSIGQDRDADGTSTEIELRDFAEAITIPLDYLIFDVVYMGSVEVAYELRNKCKVLVGSPIEILADGLDYKLLSYRLMCLEEPDVKGVCKDYMNQCSEGAITMLDCSKLGALADCFKSIVNKKRDAIYNVQASSIQTLARYEASKYIYDMADIVRVACGDDSEEYFSLCDALNQSIMYRDHTEIFLSLRFYRFCGLSMYLPHHGYNYLDNYYLQNIAWCKDTGYITE